MVDTRGHAYHPVGCELGAGFTFPGFLVQGFSCFSLVLELGNNLSRVFSHLATVYLAEV